MIHLNEMVNIEEDSVLSVQRTMIRRFTLKNRANHLTIGIVSSGGTISSVQVDNGKHETIVNMNTVKREGDASCYVQPNCSEWSSHVLGPDTLLLNTSPSQSLIYQLTTNNEILITGKIKGHLSAMAPFYFNLKSTSSSPCTIDGHYLHIRSDGVPDLPITSSPSEPPFCLNGPMPAKLIYPSCHNPTGQYDIVYGCLAPPSSGTNAILVATLTYETRSVEVHIQSNSSIPNQPVQMRVRVRREGISLMPINMNEFKCCYKLLW
ncbi:hypothetical protein HDE_02255 [Halotydeus destructor]|nr:hypothetical protein HDE_02255 [Halotydeus destructor]